MPNLFMIVLDALTPSLRGLIADALAETPEAVGEGARRLSGGVVTGLLAAVSTPPGAVGVLRQVRRADLGLLIDASPLLDSDWREDSAGDGLLGNRARPLTDGAAAESGLRPASARALLRVVEPLVLAAIARSGVASDEAGLRSYLRSLEPEATRLTPQPSAAPLLAAEPRPGSTSARRSKPWLLWLILAVLAIALMLWLAL